MKLQITVFLLLVLVVIFRYFLTIGNFKEGDKIKITTTIYSEPTQYDNYQYLKFKSLKIYLPKYPEVSFGDRVEIVGKVSSDKLKVSGFKVIEEEVGFLSKFRNSWRFVSEFVE